MYWLPKLHKTPYKARFIANSSSCTTTELSKLLTSCLTAVKNHVIRYCEKVYGGSGRSLFWSIENSGEVLGELESWGFRAAGLSACGFSALCATLPHDLIEEKLVDLIEWTFGGGVHLILPVTGDRLSSLLKTQNGVGFGLARTSVGPWCAFWMVFVLDLALGCAGGLLVFRWVLVVLPLGLVCFCFAVRGISWCLFLALSGLRLLEHLGLRLDVWAAFWVLAILALGAWSVVFVRLGCGWAELVPLMPGPHFWICVCLFQTDLFRLGFVIVAMALVLV